MFVPWKIKNEILQIKTKLKIAAINLDVASVYALKKRIDKNIELKLVV